MAEHNVTVHEAVDDREPYVPEPMVAAHRTLWDQFGKLLLGNIIVIAAVLILMAIFLT